MDHRLEYLKVVREGVSIFDAATIGQEYFTRKRILFVTDNLYHSAQAG
jgi:hypothetical protein